MTWPTQIDLKPIHQVRTEGIDDVVQIECHLRSLKRFIMMIRVLALLGL